MIEEGYSPEVNPNERLVDRDELTQLIRAWYRMTNHRHELRTAASDLGVELPEKDTELTDSDVEKVVAHLESTDDDVLFINSVVYKLSSQPNLDAVYDAVDAWRAARAWNPSKGPIAHATTEIIGKIGSFSEEEFQSKKQELQKDVILMFESEFGE